MRALRAYPGRVERDAEAPEPPMRASSIEDGAAVS